MPAVIDERLVADAARGLAADGRPYTDRQLWYAVCARLERPELTEGVAQVVSGALLIAVGVVAGILATVFVAALVPVGMVVLGLGLRNRRLERNRPTTRALAVSYDGFVRETLAPMCERGAAPAGLLPAEGVPGATPPDVSLDAEVPLIVCDRGETAQLVDALGPAGAGWRAVTEAEAGALLHTRRRVYALHDADPSGCALPLRLAAAGAREVVDLGLRPAQLTGRRLQVIEGAPFLVPAEVSRLLTASEVVWLADGRRVELAVLTPGDLVGALPDALAAPPVPPPGGRGGAVALAGAGLVRAAPELGDDERVRAAEADDDEEEPVAR